VTQPLIQEFQEYSWGLREACAWGWQPHCHLWADCLENVRDSRSDNSIGLHGLSQGRVTVYVYFSYYFLYFREFLVYFLLFRKKGRPMRSSPRLCVCLSVWVLSLYKLLNKWTDTNVIPVGYYPKTIFSNIPISLITIRQTRPLLMWNFYNNISHNILIKKTYYYGFRVTMNGVWLGAVT
jgi:hypothetical protein